MIMQMLAELSTELVRLGIFPYYLHHTDKVVGAEDFYVSIEDGQRIVQKLETWSVVWRSQIRDRPPRWKWKDSCGKASCSVKAKVTVFDLCNGAGAMLVCTILIENNKIIC